VQGHSINTRNRPQNALTLGNEGPQVNEGVTYERSGDNTTRIESRGTDDSTDTQPHAVEREIENIEALIEAAGASAFVFGISSGAALAFEAALTLGGKVKKLAMYEAPYNDDDFSACL
jgi:pimeloyl-ACP methyl ester carboxylesterase